jgi:hypothetical protein
MYRTHGNSHLMFGKYYLSLFAFVALLFALWMFGIDRLHPLSFNPVNGDFQTFNAASRFSEGQVPYRDFSNYLGMGPLLLTVPANLIFGQSFAASVVWANILAGIAFIYITTYLFRLLGNRHAFAIAVCLFIVWRAIPYLAVRVDNELLQSSLSLLARLTLISVGNMANTGHSLYAIRALLPFLIAPLLMLYFYKKDIRTLALLSFVLGVGVTWSNDFGPMTAIVFGLFAWWQNRSTKNFLVILVSGILGSSIAILLATQGNPHAWLAFNQGVAQDQYWYFMHIATKYLSPVDVPEGPATYFLLLGGMISAKLTYDFRNNPEPSKGVILAIQLTTLIVGLFSMVNNTFTAYYLSAMTYIAIILFLNYCITSAWMRAYLKHAKYLMLAIFSGTILASTAVVYAQPEDKGMGQFEAKLGAKLARSFDGYETMVEEVIKLGGTPWSTYATATEASLGIHHPSHSDYIIHVLGEENRRLYLDQFYRDNPSVVITPSANKIAWEHWSQRVNWWFYRALYERYEVAHTGPYWLIWKRKQVQSHQEATCTVKILDSGSVRISVSGDPKYAGGIAETKVSYSGTSPWYARTLVNVLDPSYEKAIATRAEGLGLVVNLSYGVPPAANDLSIPIFLDENGKGEVIIRSFPEGRGYLEWGGCKDSRIVTNTRQ